MELHTKQFQIGMNSAGAAQLWTPPEMPTGEPLIVFYKKRFPKRRSISVTIRHDLQSLSLQFVYRTVTN